LIKSIINLKFKIMKLNGLLLALLFVCGVATAQKSTFEKGDKVLNLGIGLGSGIYSGVGYTSKSPALSGSFEVGVVDNVLDKGTIGIGGYVGYSSAKYEENYLSYKFGWKYSDLIVAARGTFHYPLVDKLDTYAGLALGYDVVTAKETGDWSTLGIYGTGFSASASKAYVAGFVGARYYFSDKFAGMAELGSGIAYLTIGVALKF
jgi:hypothetical protein